MPSIELWCYRNGQAGSPGLLPKHVHFKNAIMLLWPESMKNGEKGYIWSEWADRRLISWVYKEFQTWWGPSSSGKSTDAGVFLLTDWLSAPDKTTAMVISTTKDMLEKRIWREIVRFHSMYKGGLPGHQYKHSIVYEDPTSDAGINTINGIFAHAVQKGSVAQAMGNIVGIHNDHNILIIDEMQATREAAVEAYDNLSTGKSSKFLGMGNPVSRLDPLGRASEPIKGWGSISPDIDEWKTKRGVTLYFDGLKSPAIEDPEKYFFLLNKKQIDAMKLDPGEDSPRFWSQRRGFVPPEGLVETVLTEAFIAKFSIMQPAMWKNDFKVYLGCDPAFSSHGDNCIVTPFKVGVMTNGMTGVEFLTPVQINMKASTGEPQTYYIAGEIIKLINDFNLSPSEFGMDTTGAQRTLADVIEMEWYKHKTKKDYVDANAVDYPRIHRVEFAGKPSDQIVSMSDQKKAVDCYKNRVSELWYTFREFVRFDQIRGLQHQAVQEFCSRNLDEKTNSLDSRNLLKLESKVDMKSRTGGKSPDTADSAVVCIDLVRVKLGIPPGTGNNVAVSGFNEQQMKNFDMDGGDDLYQDSSIY